MSWQGDELLSFHASTTGEDDVIERLRTRLKIEESKAKTAQEALAASQVRNGVGWVCVRAVVAR